MFIVPPATSKGILTEMKDEIVRESTTAKFFVVVTHEDIAGSWFKNGVKIEVTLSAFVALHSD